MDNKNIAELKMTGNVYNKHDVEAWMVTPKFSQVEKSSFLDVDNLVLYDEEQLKGADAETTIDIIHSFGINR